MLEIDIINNDIYDEKDIKESERMTDRRNTTERLKNIKHFINSRIFKDLDFPEDDEDLDDWIVNF